MIMTLLKNEKLWFEIPFKQVFFSFQFLVIIQWFLLFSACEIRFRVEKAYQNIPLYINNTLWNFQMVFLSFSNVKQIDMLTLLEVSWRFRCFPFCVNIWHSNSFFDKKKTLFLKEHTAKPPKIYYNTQIA